MFCVNQLIYVSETVKICLNYNINLHFHTNRNSMKQRGSRINQHQGTCNVQYSGPMNLQRMSFVHAYTIFFIRNQFISNSELESLTIKKLLELQGKS